MQKYSSTEKSDRKENSGSSNIFSKPRIIGDKDSANNMFPSQMISTISIRSLLHPYQHHFLIYLSSKTSQPMLLVWPSVKFYVGEKLNIIPTPPRLLTKVSINSSIKTLPQKIHVFLTKIFNNIMEESDINYKIYIFEKQHIKNSIKTFKNTSTLHPN